MRKKQCVKPCAKFSGLLLVPHSKVLISLICDGKARKAVSTFLMSSALALSLNLNKTTWRNDFCPPSVFEDVWQPKKVAVSKSKREIDFI